MAVSCHAVETITVLGGVCQGLKTFCCFPDVATSPRRRSSVAIIIAGPVMFVASWAVRFPQPHSISRAIILPPVAPLSFFSERAALYHFSGRDVRLTVEWGDERHARRSAGGCDDVAMRVDVDEPTRGEEVEMMRFLLLLPQPPEMCRMSYFNLSFHFYFSLSISFFRFEYRFDQSLAE